MGQITNPCPFIEVGLPDPLFTDEICFLIETMIEHRYDSDHIRLKIDKTFTKTMWVECSDDIDSDVLLDRLVNVIIHSIMQ